MLRVARVEGYFLGPRTRSARLPDCRRAEIQASSDVACSHGIFHGSSANGFSRRERSGVSHSDDLNTMMYNETLPARSTLVVKHHIGQHAGITCHFLIQVNERAYEVLLHPVGDLARLARLEIEIFMLLRVLDDACI